ncbi:MAG: AAA family ATPase [Saprospiraceae bacterium]|nr:AAA family ATPase [Saprospiraceae bacterium]
MIKNSYIKSLKISNFRGFENLEIDFSKTEKLILLGKNGIGKTSILDAISQAFSYFSATIYANDLEEIELDYSINEDDISIDQDQCIILVEFVWNEIPIVVETTLGLNYEKPRFIMKPEFIINTVFKNIKSNSSYKIPILSYYRSYRSKIDLDIEGFKPTYDKRLFAIHHAFRSEFSNYVGFEHWYSAVYESNTDESAQTSTKHIDLAILKFLSTFHETEYTDLRLVHSRKITNYKYHNYRIEIKKNDKWVLLRLMSSGEKSLIFLVADIAKRLSVGYNYKENCLNGNGIVLIDEIELHLHPEWQRNILKSLSSSFPSIQFILTTHSPLVLSTITNQSIYLIGTNDYNTISINPNSKDINSILQEMLGVSARPPILENKINHLLKNLAIENSLSSESERLFNEIIAMANEDDPLIRKIKNKILLLES